MDAGSCPACGGTAEVPGGLYEVIGDTILILVKDHDAYDVAIELVRHPASFDYHQAAMAMADRRRVDAPALRRFADLMLSARGQAATAWLALLAAIVTLIKIRGLSSGRSFEEDPESVPDPDDLKRDVRVIAYARRHM